MTIPLLTSIPASLKRFQNGQDVGIEYQEACARSWHENGFKPYSVNSHTEIAARPEISVLAKKMGVEIIPVYRDASHITGRHHVFIADMISVLPGDAGKFAIANADVILRKNAGDFSRYLQKGSFIVSQRADITDYREVPAIPALHRCGFDFLVTDIESARRVPDIGLIFGMPWWDHFFPLMLGFNGLHRERMRNDIVLHLMHEERWEPDIWVKLGNEFIDKMTPYMSSSNQTSRYWMQRLRTRISETANPNLNTISAANIDVLINSLWGMADDEKFSKRLKRQYLKTLFFLAYLREPHLDSQGVFAVLKKWRKRKRLTGIPLQQTAN